MNLRLEVPTLSHLREAAAGVLGVSQETPLLGSPALAEITGAASVHVKPESLQRTGSFKFRGAYWRLTRLTAAEAERGVIAFSSGNFAQGLAAAGALLGIPVTIVMPVDAPLLKRQATESYGARVILSDHGERGREDAAAEMASNIAKHDGTTLLHPFDDPEIVAGQATLAMEALQQARDAGVRFDEVYCPVGGAGLIAGTALAFHYLSSPSTIVGVEPEGFAGLAASIAAGEPTAVAGAGSTICDGMMARAPGAYPFASIASVGGVRTVTVTDSGVRRAQKFALETLKLVFEPSGAAGLAATLDGAGSLEGKNVLIIASGGNAPIEAVLESIAD